jgi:hypothetical protein
VAQGGDHHRSTTQAKKKAEIAGGRTKIFAIFFRPPTSNFAPVFRLCGCGGKIMTFDGFTEDTGQTLIIRTALEALGAVTEVFIYMALAAFVIYLIGLWRLCRAEYRQSR